ncbi:MAG: Gfo/Idh/MocA family oxidoreductase [Moorea sp. SIO2B7]|nr:Gfo/Idh/MocA family oxidoreductase [Moorena sp. SIO2B7]
MSKIIRWGILGTGYVAREFAQGLRSLPDAQLLAIGSRTLTKAEEFARQLNVPRAYQSYEDLVKDDNIDVVYIATPASRHKDDCILCLEAGKAILCEKPFTLNAQEASEIIALARQKQLFCMEAMWMRFMPLIQKVQSLINSGVIGDIRILMADFGVPTEFNPDNRFFNPQLGGGALLDRGIYCLSLAFQLLGLPSQIVSQASIGETGVDEQSSIILNYPQGKQAILYATLRTYTSNEAVIMGTKGKIRIHEPFCRPNKISIINFPAIVTTTSSPSFSRKQKMVSYLKQNPLIQRLSIQLKSYISPLLGKSAKAIVQPFNGNGYNYEAAEVMRCLRDGELESKIMPLDQTLMIMEAMDTISTQWNLGNS